MSGAKKWLWVRIGIVALGALSGIEMTSADAVAKSNIDWLACAVLLGAVPLMLLAVIGFQARNPSSAPTWRRPSWCINPFLPSEPLQFFHLAAFAFMAGGFVGVATLPFRGVSAAPLAASLLSVGAGAWLGIHLSMKVCRKKMEAG
ncbi:MAG TPA: hypothetical protein VMU04_10120 [Candidatus Acidoferrum sp.]|nr:hypothetical protein [Candidatus Acidoferrum sp.]